MFPGHNHSSDPKFILLGFQVPNGSRIIFFLSFLMAYLSTISGNLLIIMLVSASRLLRSPMYFFLCHLSFCDIMLSSSVVPYLLQVTMHNGSYLTVTGCIIQFQFFGFSTSTECLLLTMMSYDRYVAICKPLHYQIIMNFTFCLGLVMLSWMLGLVFASIVSVGLSQLDFCTSAHIDHFFCDFAPIVQLSCSDTTVVQIIVFVLAMPESGIETIFIISTYVCIFLAIHRISSTTGRQKAFSTYSSHLVVVCTYYGTLIITYVASSGGSSLTMNKIVSLMYTVVTPLLNPLIYSLRNREIKVTIKNILGKRKRKMLRI